MAAAALFTLFLGLAMIASQSGPAEQTATDSTATNRRRMIQEQIEARGISNRAVLDAMTRVPRHIFVPPQARPSAYEDRPLPIGFGQTISQPYIVAYMTEALQLSRDHRVLEIGTGSGYQAAVLSLLSREVYSIEIVPELADSARRTLTAGEYTNVQVRTGNGYLGWPERAPFARIIVTAAPPEVPRALIEQLEVGGMMLVPVGTLFQEMTIVRKTASGVTEQRTIPVRFVPMVNKP
jgi:protein-L-isoaspartate(D-aspartate) O-methyltransferase